MSTSDIGAGADLLSAFEALDSDSEISGAGLFLPLIGEGFPVGFIMPTLLSACPIRGGSLQFDHHRGANFQGGDRLPKSGGDLS